MNSLNAMDAQLASVAECSSCQKNEKTIASVEQLYPLLSGFTLTGLRTHRIALKLSWLSNEENSQWSERINREYTACGCSEGAVAGMLGSGVGTLVFFGNQWIGHPWSNTYAAIAAGAVLIGAMGLGKAIGLLRARRRLQKTIQEIKQTNF